MWLRAEGEGGASNEDEDDVTSTIASNDDGEDVAGETRGEGATAPSDVSTAEGGSSAASSASPLPLAEEGTTEEGEERARLEDLAFFVSQMKAYANRLRGEANRATVLVQEMEGTFVVPPGSLGSLSAKNATAMQTGPVAPSADAAGASPEQRIETTRPPPRKRRILSAPARNVGGPSRDPDIARQRGSGVFGVYTMHGASATRLGDDERHSLMHLNHISAPQDPSDVTLSRPTFDSEGGFGGEGGPQQGRDHGLAELRGPEAKEEAQVMCVWRVGSCRPCVHKRGMSRCCLGVSDLKSDLKSCLATRQALKHACRPCVEIEEMLSLKQAMGSIKSELRQLQALRLEARKLRRESEALDAVVER